MISPTDPPWTSVAWREHMQASGPASFLPILSFTLHMKDLAYVTLILSCPTTNTCQCRRVQFLGWENPLEKEMATHSSILVWKIPQTEASGGLQSMVLQKSCTTQWLNNNKSYYYCCLCYWEALVVLNFFKKIILRSGLHTDISNLTDLDCLLYFSSYVIYFIVHQDFFLLWTF